MTVGSLFAGIGGFDLGLERAGFDIKWQVENDPYCTRVLAKHWPHVTRYGDIRTIDWRTIHQVDLLCGGFPCQPFSLAGQRKGTADDRYLWPEMRLAVLHAEPTWVLAENVPGLIGPPLDEVLSDLEAAGYECGTLAVPACAVDAPHIRQRIWILAYARRRNGKEGPWKTKSVDKPASHLIERCVGWEATPKLCRAVDGIPNRLDRLRGLGNAIVPQIAEWLGRQILEVLPL